MSLVEIGFSSVLARATFTVSVERTFVKVTSVLTSLTMAFSRRREDMDLIARKISNMIIRMKRTKKIQKAAFSSISLTSPAHFVGRLST